jgi:hypothetical protein
MENFIFIMGCGHSGTTILNKIIGNHKNIYGMNYETGLFNKYSSEIIIEKLKEMDINRKKLNKKWICEKTPTHIYYIDTIYSMFINPKIIIMIRDGRDVVASLNKRYGDFDKSVERWINDNMEWLKNKNNHMFHIIKYEDMIANPQSEIKKICDFLGEEYYPEIIDYNINPISLPNNFFNGLIENSKHNMLRKWQINQPLYDGTKRWIHDLTTEQKSILLNHPQFIELMTQFNYIMYDI